MGIPLGPLHEDDPALEVIRNLPPKANAFVLTITRVMGNREIKVEKGVELELCKWSGKDYLVRYEYLGQYKHYESSE